MVNKHFFKSVFIFTSLIALGLAGIFFLSSMDQGDGGDTIADSSIVKTIREAIK